MTGIDSSAKAVFVGDEVVAPVTVGLMPGTEFVQVWGDDARTSLPHDGSPPAWQGFFPPAEGFRFLVWTLGPESTTLPPDLDIGAALAEMAERLPGLSEHVEPDHPGMHTTDTVDFNFVVSGEVWLELDDGQEKLLRTGDCVVQNGTRHAWHNRTDGPVTIATAIVGAPRR